MWELIVDENAKDYYGTKSKYTNLNKRLYKINEILKQMKLNSNSTKLYGIIISSKKNIKPLKRGEFYYY